jgi:predicted DNA-binding protein (MmcQ/YjbR family)
MSRKLVNAICRKFPGAEVSDPWGGGHDAWKVGGKMFACIGAVMPGVSVKTDSIETAQMLIDAGVGVKAPYFHRSWVNLPWGTSEDELRHRLTASYGLVRSGLTKKAQAELDLFESAAPPDSRIGPQHRKRPEPVPDL